MVLIIISSIKNELRIYKIEHLLYNKMLPHAECDEDFILIALKYMYRC